MNHGLVTIWQIQCYSCLGSQVIKICSHSTRKLPELFVQSTTKHLFSISLLLGEVGKHCCSQGYKDLSSLVQFSGKYFGSGFEHVPGGADYRDRSVLSYHYYCFLLEVYPVPGNSTIPFFKRVVCDDIEGPAVFRSISVIPFILYFYLDYSYTLF